MTTDVPQPIDVSVEATITKDDERMGLRADARIERSIRHREVHQGHRDNRRSRPTSNAAEPAGSDRYRDSLLHAVQDGGRFDETSREPEAWQTPLADLRVHEWSRRWLGEQWQEWQPRTRASATEAFSRFITVAVERGAKPPDGLRVYLYTGLAPGPDGGLDVQFERWMAKHCLTLAELDRERFADIDRQLGLKLDGSQLAANTSNRIRIVARASVQ